MSSLQCGLLPYAMISVQEWPTGEKEKNKIFQQYRSSKWLRKSLGYRLLETADYSEGIVKYRLARVLSETE